MAVAAESQPAAAEVSNLQPRLPGLAQGQQGRDRGVGGWHEWPRLFSCFGVGKSPLFFRGATPEVNYLQSGRPPVGVTICRSGARLPEPPLKGPPVVGEPSLVVEEGGREEDGKTSTHAVQFILISSPAR